jgi:galactokinase
VIEPNDVARAFEAAVGRRPRLYRAPGRVNLIGEHTDYNDGFVMPMALDRSTWVAAAPRSDRQIVVRSREYNETATIDLAAPRSGPTKHWTDYVRGVAFVLDENDVTSSPAGRSFSTLARDQHERSTVDAPTPLPREGGQGRLVGADLFIASDVPTGAGLSSSAALEVACGMALADLAGLTLDLTTLALACQRAEHEFAGTRCGVMDQMIACYGRAGHALLLDTRSLQRTWVPLPPAVRIVVCNTMVTHTLASAEYNARRADCEAGVRALARRIPGIRALRDATLLDLDAIRGEVSPQVWRRCRHVISENDRVGRAAAALAAGDFPQVGGLMAASHASLRDDYEVSCPELDIMVAIVSALDGVFGARMTGGGFGGCVVALTDAAIANDRLQETIQQRYQANTGLRPDVWVCAAGDGVEKASVSFPSTSVSST